jgi:glycosyltransferase involved in cell wall biosynthesis
LNESKVTFLIAHYNCPEFIEICLDSIRRFCSIPYQITVGDNGSKPEYLDKLHRLLQPGDELYEFSKPDWHTDILEKLYRKVTTRYTFILDQDCVLLSPEWVKLLDELKPPHRLMVGARDYCCIRNSPSMVHASFLLLDKTRIDENLTGPLFYGEKPGYETYQIEQPEPYHALPCKALQFNPDSIVYLEPLSAPNYGYGTFWCYHNLPLAYHHWYSGRAEGFSPWVFFEGRPIRWFQKNKNRFIHDYQTGRIQIPDDQPGKPGMYRVTEGMKKFAGLWFNKR